MQLNAAQREAVHASGHLLVTACPGSGKTALLAHRAAHLLADPAAQVCAVTFTQDAARELEGRARKAAKGAEGRLIVGTFHALARRQLSMAGKLPRLLPEHEVRDLVRRAWEAGSASIDIETVVHEIERRKSTLEPLGGDATYDYAYAAFLRYQKHLRNLDGVDFHDLLLLAVRGMRDGSIPPLPATHLLVDEGQDMSDVELGWCECFIARGASVTIVGDDDQSLYAFRYSLGFAGMERFRANHGALVVPLDLTYRCAKSVLSHAALLIAHNEARMPKSLVTANQAQGVVRVESADSRVDEAKLVAKAIHESGEPTTWAVLARTNRLLDDVETALSDLGIPNYRTGGIGFWERPGSQLFLGVLEGLVRPDFRELEAVLRSAHAADSALAFLRDALGASSPRERVAHFHRLKIPREISGREMITSFRDRSSGWKIALPNPKRLKLALFGIADWLNEFVPMKVRRMNTESCANAFSSMQGPVARRLEKTRMASAKKNKDSAVPLMTLHGSKGLQFERVWIVGAQQGVLPHDDTPVEDERRLCYVGMTRAKSELTLSYAKHDARGALLAPSQFLGEACLV